MTKRLFIIIPLALCLIGYATYAWRHSPFEYLQQKLDIPLLVLVVLAVQIAFVARRPMRTALFFVWSVWALGLCMAVLTQRHDLEWNHYLDMVFWILLPAAGIALHRLEKNLPEATPHPEPKTAQA
jgi:hypothetical protein